MLTLVPSVLTALGLSEKAQSGDATAFMRWTELGRHWVLEGRDISFERPPPIEPPARADPCLIDALSALGGPIRRSGGCGHD